MTSLSRRMYRPLGLIVRLTLLISLAVSSTSIAAAAEPTATPPATDLSHFRSADAHVAHSGPLPPLSYGPHFQRIPDQSNGPARPGEELSTGSLGLSSTMKCTETGSTQPCTPPLVYGKGSVEHSPTIVLIFWGPKWNADKYGIATALIAMFRAMGNQNGSSEANYWDAMLTKYCDNSGCPSAVVSLYQNQAYLDDTSPPGSAIDNGGSQAIDEINAFNNLHHFTSGLNVQYILLPEEGTSIQGNSFCAYHASSRLLDNKIWSIIPYLPDRANLGCVFGPVQASNVVPAEERVTSHEFAETATDPYGDGWTTREPSGPDFEIGDLCANIDSPGQLTTDGTNLYLQYLWDNWSNGGNQITTQNCVHSFVPNSPASITASPGTNQATVSWINATSDNGQPTTGYEVRAFDAGNNLVGNRFLNGNVNSAVMSRLPASTVHFLVFAFNQFGSGPFALSGNITVPGLAIGTVYSWLTTADQSALLQAQPAIALSPDTGSLPTIYVDSSQHFQQMVGFGASVTDSSAWLMANKLSWAQRKDLMNHLFNPSNAGLSFLRQPIGASDFALNNYTYDDMPGGLTDPNLAHFSIAHDDSYIVPALQQALALNDGVSIMGSPWSPPAWMRSGVSMSGRTGGTLNVSSYSAYASYLQQYVTAYRARGLNVSAITVQNEPLNAPVFPGMLMTSTEQANFIGGYLGPAFKRAGLSTGIVTYDHNWDHPEYANSVLADATANPYIDGSAFHCYFGTPVGQLTTHNAYPSKNIYLTECSGGSWAPNFGDNLNWDTSNLVIDGTRNWARAVATWNIALDTSGGPHYNDGNSFDSCWTCRGVVTIDPTTGSVTYNVEYYVLGQASKAADPGAIRIASNDFGVGWVRDVAFQNRDGSIGMVVLNNAQTPQSFHVSTGSEGFDYTNLPVNAVVTFRWRPTGAHTTTLNRGGWTASASSSCPWCWVKGAIDGTESTRWSSGQPQAPGDYFQIDMGSDQIFNQITLDTGPNNAGDYPRWYEVYFSEDGSNWGTAYVSGPGTGQVATVDLPGTQRARFIRVVQTQSSGSWWSIAEFNVALVLTRSTWIATASPSSLGQDVYRALDGIPTTQWKSGGPQTGTGDYFQVDMRSAQKFSKIALDAGGNNTGEYPRSYAVYVSQDGTTWGGPVALGSGTGQITTASFATVSARFIRVVQTGSSAAWWSIAEFDVYP